MKSVNRVMNIRGVEMKKVDLTHMMRGNIFLLLRIYSAATPFFCNSDCLAMG